VDLVFTPTIPEAEIVALADPHQENLRRFVDEIFPAQTPPPTFSDHRAMLAEVPLDGVVIVTPHAHHFRQAMDAIDAGCHVLMEKPMVISTADAQTLIGRARERQRVVSIAFPGPFTCEFQYIR
jgi:predicted dehydrogenase